MVHFGSDGADIVYELPGLQVKGECVRVVVRAKHTRMPVYVRLVALRDCGPRPRMTQPATHQAFCAPKPCKCVTWMCVTCGCACHTRAGVLWGVRVLKYSGTMTFTDAKNNLS